MSESEHAGGGGAAGQPTPAAGGPAPVVPDDLRELLPEGFELPDGVLLVHAPPLTPAQQAQGARQLAADADAYAGAVEARVEKLRAQAAAAEDAAAAMQAHLEEARQAAADAHAHATGLETAAGGEGA